MRASRGGSIIASGLLPWLVACAAPAGTSIDAQHTLDATTEDVAAEDAGASVRDANTPDAHTADAFAHTADAGPHYDVDLAGTTVSGISSGGFMAVQFHVAYSSITRGAAIFAAGPYLCSGGTLGLATTSCAYGSPPIDVPALVALTHDAYTRGTIDDPAALATQRVFLFGGASDVVVSPFVVDALAAYYAAFLPTGSIEYVSRRPATSHTWPTTRYGNPCSTLASPYLGACGYDGAGHALQSLLGTLSPPSAAPSGQLVAIAQGAFIADTRAHALDDTAYLYVPTTCARGERCRVHIAFHGCLQGSRAVGDAFYAHAGLNEWADTNHLLVLYPQAIATSSAPANPNGCWDWWGYESTDFASRNAPQLAMVRAMLDALAR